MRRYAGVSRTDPGLARLPTETELAQRFGVSRGVARESLRSLEERGLVTVKHGIGATVRPSTDWDMFSLEVIEALLEHEGGTKLLTDYLECRRLLEIEAAALAAGRATSGDLMALSAALDRMTAMMDHCVRRGTWLLGLHACKGLLRFG